MSPSPPAPLPSPPHPPGEGRRHGGAELRRIERELSSALAEIRFGSIEIVIHDGRVTQIERRERVRFDRAEDSLGSLR